MPFFDPNDPMWRMLREVEHQREWRRLVESVRNERPEEAMLERLRREDAEVRRREKELRGLMGPADYSQRLQNLVAGFESARSLTDRFDVGGGALSGALERMQAETDHWLKLQRQITASVGTSGLASILVDKSIASYELSSLRLLGAIEARFERRPASDVAARLFEPLAAFSEYARNGLDRTLSESNVEVRAVIEEGVALADSQISSATEAVAEVAESLPSEGVESEGESDLADMSRFPPSVDASLFFTRQEEELRATAAAFDDGAESPPRSIFARRAERQHELVRLLIACNQAAQLRKQAHIFRPSDSLVLSASDLPFLHPGSPDSLGKLVDVMYLVLYEASGKLRRLRPYLRAEEINIVDAVAEIRHKVFRHDIEQEAPEVVRHQWRELGESLSVFGETDIPHTLEEHTRLHDSIVRQCILVLEALLAGIKRTEA